MAENKRKNEKKGEEISKSPEESVEREDSIPEEDEIENPFQKLKEERDELLDKYLRSLANYENLRKRTQQEKDNIYNIGITRVFREVLPVVDDLTRAFDTLEKDDIENKQDGFIKGIRIIYSKLLNILRIHQIEPYNSKGEKFDPSRHEAVHVVESDLEEGTILEEVDKGYLIKNQILRPARVIVAKTKGDLEETEEFKEKENKNEK